MPTVYRILPDWNRYRSLAAESPEALRVYRFDGCPIGEAWRPPRMKVDDPSKEEGTFWGCFFHPALFAVAWPPLCPLIGYIDKACEVLPLYGDEHDLRILNVTYVLNCLDRKRSTFAPGFTDRIRRYVFHPHRLLYSLFKLPETRASELFCAEGVVSPEDEFKGMVERHGLTGLVFEEVWSDER